MELYEGQELEESTSFTTSLVNTAKNKPVLVAAVTGLLSVCGYGAYRWRTKRIPTALFLVQLRVAAQGTAVGIFSLGMMYHMLQDFVFTDKKTEQKGEK